MTREARIWSFKKTPWDDWYWQHTEWKGHTTNSGYFTGATLCFNNARENGLIGATPPSGE